MAVLRFARRIPAWSASWSQIQHQTGLVIDGLSHDQRMYGQYGPGIISSTLTALLDGSGYDFIIVGGGSSHAAARLILSTPGSIRRSPQQQLPRSQEATQRHNCRQIRRQPADPTAPPQAKSPQEIFNELRRMHPQ